MIQTKRNRILWFVFIALTIVNLAAAATVIYHIRKYHLVSEDVRANAELTGDSIPSPPGPGFLMKELGFDEDQQNAFHESRVAFRDKVLPLLRGVRELNNELADEFIKDKPDTLKMQAISRKIGDIQVRLKLLTIGHMHEVKSIANPEQQEKLGMFYRDLLSRDGRPPGQGKQHRYRHGRGNN
ncbi:MAG: hypothetical protein V1775_07235 [Bacteroidota bacterium]